MYRHLCIIIRGKTLVSYAFNGLDTHAGVGAIRLLRSTLRAQSSRDSARDKRANLDILSLRYTLAGIGNARPCQHCSKFLVRNADLFGSISHSETNCIVTRTMDAFKQEPHTHISRGNLPKEMLSQNGASGKTKN